MIAIKQQLSAMKPIQLADINALVTDSSALTTLAEAIHYSKADEYTEMVIRTELLLKLKVSMFLTIS
ncbi:hypothetical protein EFR94_03305 [Levilactobacillus brevis]|uniref:hypothetical protein n=1 Tax=Levilactobacillus brevis TaxID=1580 RepID=UPI0021A89810|nr:hypothetical protein [Levilactobacillus brevis]MCT3566422.1 hypothetical protein [Levilactobacillus brevis]